MPPARPPELEQAEVRNKIWTAAIVVIVATAALWLYKEGYTASLKEYVAKSQLGKSGFPAAFSLIFVSEIGDKTFFIAALLAAKFGRWLSFSASLLSLSVMSVISVGIGQSFRHVPEFLKSGLPIGEWASVALLVYFGIRTIKDAWDTPEGTEGGGELEGARDSIDSAEASGRIGGTSAWQAFVQVATLIFVAEWGDRSMLATIVLAVSQSPVGVAGGAIAGHALATLLAVLGGAIASKYMSEKTIGYLGGTLFLAFAAATLLGVY
jgi:putative Ca2+/H+ antiporter (TMEM165/GDT1 family)